jgi:glycine/D-amino acid oxidase-like deaminating enzyme
VSYDVITIGGGLAGAALGRALAEPGRIPDVVAHGPDSPCDEAARRRFFAED